MDMDIVFASNLVVEFKVKKEGSEIVEYALNLFHQVKGIPAKISDFGLRGMLRVVFKPLVSSCLKKFVSNLFISRSARYPWSVGCKPTSWRYPRNKSEGCQRKVLILGSWNWLRVGWCWWCSQSARSSQDCRADHHRTGTDWKLQNRNLVIQSGEELHCVAQQVLHAFDQRHSDKGLRILDFLVLTVFTIRPSSAQTVLVFSELSWSGKVWLDETKLNFRF